MTDNRDAQPTRPRPNEEDTYRPAPHSDDAEAALIGAALMSADAVASLVTITRPEDFYRPTHRILARAIGELFAEGTPVDSLLLAEHLERKKALDEVGGVAEILSFTRDVPGTANAPHYARIVHDHATLRRLIQAGASIGDFAFEAPADVHAAVLRAQELVAGVASQNGSRTFSNLEIADVGEVLDGDLDPPEADFLRRRDDRALVYAGKVNVLQGEPSSGKTWLALWAIEEVLRMGGSAAMIDYEDTKKGIVGRLLALGADPVALRERFAYIQPTGPIGQAEKLELGHLLDRLNPDVVVIDSVGESLSRDGLDEDRARDVTEWVDRVPRWIARTGAGVILLDHVTKDPEHRGRWARGSGAKLGAVDGSAFSVTVSTAFSRQRPGVLKLKIAKDKPGGVGPIGATAAVATIEPRGNGARVLIALEVDGDALHVSDSFRPSFVMAKIAETLTSSKVPITARTLKSLIASKPDVVETALVRLQVEGYVVEAKEPGSSTKTLRLVKPFDEAPVAHGNPPELDEPPPGLFDHDEPDLPPPPEPPAVTGSNPDDLEAWKDANL